MSNNSQIISCADMITQAFSGIERTDIEQTNQTLNAWKKTVSGIRGCGANLAAHSRIIDLKNGILLVETDHPGWIQLFQMNKSYILRGLKQLCPELSISTIAFRLKGSDAALSSGYSESDMKKERQHLENVISDEEEKLSELGFNDKKEKNYKKAEELPQELQDLFKRLKESLLTNTDK